MTKESKGLFLRIVILLGLGLLISLLMYWGAVDQDFFSQYYVGKGVLEGKLMYGDFTDNKGPILYLFFSGLSIVFGDRYGLALVFGSLVLTFLSIWGLTKMADEWVEKRRKNEFGEVTFLVVLTLYLGSFYLGGIYAENLSLVFLVWSLVMIRSRRYFWGGILFSGAVLSRQTFVLFLPYIFYQIYFHDEGRRGNLARSILGCGLVVAAVMTYLILKRDFFNFIQNSVVFNINYASAVASFKWNSIWLGLWDGGFYRVFFGLALVLFVCLWGVVRSEKRMFDILLLLVCSTLATFSGGVFYAHHFAQFSLVVSISLGVLIFKMEHAALKKIALLFIMVSAMGAYARYWEYGRLGFFDTTGYRPTEINSIVKKNYLMVISFYPKLYFDYDKQSPDRYFQPFFLSSIFNSDSRREVSNHKDNMRLRLGNTAFAVIRRNKLDEQVIDEYFANFGKEFGLVRVEARRLPGATLEVYWAGNEVK